MRIYKHSNNTVWLFGGGLIGGSVSNYLDKLYGYNFASVKVLWDDFESINIIASQIVSKSNLPYDATCKISLIWAAGKSSFYSSVQEVEIEFIYFQKLIDCLLRSVKNSPIDVVFVSSAGGLYEGSINISRKTKMSIRRPYGELKKKQEEYLLSNSRFDKVSIIRPSSVYGYISTKTRMGLIPTMIYNALTSRGTILSGNLYTLRDYVWVDDVAKFIFNKIFSDSDGIYILANCKPSSILEIRREVERVTRRRVLFKMNDLIVNNADITFSNYLPLLTWDPINISTGISRILMKQTDHSFGNYSHKFS
jgi:nucleoside-diphosphate-sugar epimerase